MNKELVLFIFLTTLPVILIPADSSRQPWKNPYIGNDANSKPGYFTKGEICGHACSRVITEPIAKLIRQVTDNSNGGLESLPSVGF